MFFMAMGAMNVHDVYRFAGFDDCFQWTMLAILAAGAIDTVRHFITVLAHNIILTHLIMFAVVLADTILNSRSIMTKGSGNKSIMASQVGLTGTFDIVQSCHDIL